MCGQGTAESQERIAPPPRRPVTHPVFGPAPTTTHRLNTEIFICIHNNNTRTGDEYETRPSASRGMRVN